MYINNYPDTSKRQVQNQENLLNNEANIIETLCLECSRNNKIYWNLCRKELEIEEYKEEKDNNFKSKVW